MLRRLLTTLRHPVSRNVVALYIVQLATFVAPIVTLPYVARVLDSSQFGLVVFAQGFAFVLVIVIDWGLTLTGVRVVAAAQSDAAGLAEAVRRVRGAQLLLAAAGAVVTAAVLPAFPAVRHHPGVLGLSWLAAASMGLAPNWFFQGIERPRVPALIQLGLRAIGVVLTFVFVRHGDDAWVVVVLFAATGVGSLLVMDWLMYRRVTFLMPQWSSSISEIRASTTIFVSTLAVALVTSFNVVLLGLLRSSEDVAHFGASERLVRTSITLLGPIGAAVIPRMTALQAAGERDRARRLLSIAVVVAVVPALVITAGLIAGASPILHLVYGEDFVHDSAPILRVMALIIPVNVTGVVLGVWLLSLHRDRLILTIALTAGVSNVVFGCVFTELFGPIGMAWSVIAAEGVGALGAIIAVRRNARRAVAEAPL